MDWEICHYKLLFYVIGILYNFETIAAEVLLHGRNVFVSVTKTNRNHGADLAKQSVFCIWLIVNDSSMQYLVVAKDFAAILKLNISAGLEDACCVQFHTIQLFTPNYNKQCLTLNSFFYQ